MQHLLVFLFLLLIAGCQSTTTTPPVTSNTTSVIPVANHEQVVRTLFDYFNKHDWASMAALYADTATFRDPALGIDLVQQTHQDIIAKYKELHKMVPDVKDEITAIYACGDGHVTVEFISTGTGPDGESFRLPICAVLTIENGKITKDFTYYDNF